MVHARVHLSFDPVLFVIRDFIYVSQDPKDQLLLG